ncbi:hypothetical protein EJ110_NYTH19272 [Nymphaea thermarum]|nr:hypothetical protein EJ110_NYTH19272 [Nymphaea thermarum]
MHWWRRQYTRHVPSTLSNRIRNSRHFEEVLWAHDRTHEVGTFLVIVEFPSPAAAVVTVAVSAAAATVSTVTAAATVSAAVTFLLRCLTTLLSPPPAPPPASPPLLSRRRPCCRTVDLLPDVAPYSLLSSSAPSPSGSTLLPWCSPLSPVLLLFYRRSCPLSTWSEIMAASSSSTVNTNQTEIGAYRSENVLVQVITLRLTKENYFTWSAAMTMEIAGRGRIAYIDGRNPEPARTSEEDCKRHVGDFRANDQALYVAKEWKNRVFLFLAGLNDEFEGVRSQILNSGEMPSMEDVYSCIEAEEQRRLVTTEGKRDLVPCHERSALVSRGPGGNIRSLRRCTHCKKTGHTVDYCWDLHPEKKGNKGRSSIGKTPVSEVPKSSGEKVSISVDQLRELRAYLGRIDVNQVETSDETKANHALAVVGDSGNPSVGEWIVDSGASHHMTARFACRLCLIQRLPTLLPQPSSPLPQPASVDVSVSAVVAPASATVALSSDGLFLVAVSLVLRLSDRAVSACLSACTVSASRRQSAYLDAASPPVSASLQRGSLLLAASQIYGSLRLLCMLLFFSESSAVVAFGISFFVSLFLISVVSVVSAACLPSVDQIYGLLSVFACI